MIQQKINRKIRCARKCKLQYHKKIIITIKSISLKLYQSDIKGDARNEFKHIKPINLRNKKANTLDTKPTRKK